MSFQLTFAEMFPEMCQAVRAKTSIQFKAIDIYDMQQKSQLVQYTF
jgi:hypothetical protein